MVSKTGGGGARKACKVSTRVWPTHLVMSMKAMNTRWGPVPQRAWTTSRAVWMAGHLRLISTASTAKSSTWMVAPLAYQKGPDTPYWKATLEDWRRVAAQVHLLTMSQAVRPTLMERPAVLNSSLVCTWPVYLSPRYTMPAVKREKTPPVGRWSQGVRRSHARGSLL